MKYISGYKGRRGHVDRASGITSSIISSKRFPPICTQSAFSLHTFAKEAKILQWVEFSKPQNPEIYDNFSEVSLHLGRNYGGLKRVKVKIAPKVNKLMVKGITTIYDAAIVSVWWCHYFLPLAPPFLTIEIFTHPCGRVSQKFLSSLAPPR